KPLAWKLRRGESRSTLISGFVAHEPITFVELSMVYRRKTKLSWPSDPVNFRASEICFSASLTHRFGRIILSIWKFSPEITASIYRLSRHQKNRSIRERVFG